jgi:adenosylcobinamide hydrolase
MNTPVKDISIHVSDACIHLQSVNDLSTLSSGVVGGGFQKTRHIINAHVDKNYFCPNPAADLRRFARASGIHENFIGMMTAAKIDSTRPVFLTEHGLTVGAITTAGLNNSTCAGVTPPFLPSSQAGTINIIIFLDARLSRAAMVNAIITATEAKTAALQSLEARTKDDQPVTGTSTDSIVIAATGNGDYFKYAGSVTLPGWLMARAVRLSIMRALSGS